MAEPQGDQEQDRPVVVVIDRPRPARAVPITTSSPLQVICGGACVLAGWSIRNTDAANPISYTLYNSADASGAVVASGTLAGGASVIVACPDRGVCADSALSLQLGAATVTGAVWVVT